MKLLKPLLLMIILLSHTLFATNTQVSKDDNSLAVFYTINGNIEKTYNNFVEKKIKNIGFNLTDPHKRLNDQYETKYGSTVLDVLSFLPVVNDNVILPLLKIDPRIAGFAPFNMLIYKKLDENITHIGHLQPKVMLDILGITNKEVRKKFTASFAPLDKKIENTFSGKKSFTTYKKLPKETMINFEYEFDIPKDIDDFIDEFQNKFELAFINKHYLIAGYHNFMDASDNAKEILSDYDAFWTYSLCHLEFSYTMFDNKGAIPQAGLFAPCTMYIYIKKGTNKLVVGMFRLNNWSDTLNIQDKKRLAIIKKLDKEIPQILKDFGMRDLLAPQEDNIKQGKVTKKIIKPKISKAKEDEENIYTISLPKLPKVPRPIEAPKAIRLKGSLVLEDRSIKFSKRVPPNYVAHSFDKKQKIKNSTNMRIGEINHGRISAYLRGEYLSVKIVEEKLKNAGFKILSKEAINKEKNLISMVFTNDSLIAMASTPKRGFIASLRVLIDSQNKSISITNPLYMAKGFLQDDFDEKKAKAILVKLISQFPKLKNSKDAVKFQLLPTYQFMKGMPHFQDMLEIASGDELLERLKNNKKVVFQQKINNKATLIGIKLEKRTRKFINRIGRNNAGMLPYPVLIENNKAMILDPKYYISYMYPLLKMSEFMTIANIPDAMVKDCERVFKK